jgi:hypothetical protein
MAIYELIRSLFGLSSGRDCRHCGDSIERADDFGLSEGVCAPCRS